LIQQFPDYGFEWIQFAAAGFSDNNIPKWIFQVFLYSSAGDMKLARNLTTRELLFMSHPVDSFDRLGIRYHHCNPPGRIPL
jgi:hypothetical protein